VHWEQGKIVVYFEAVMGILDGRSHHDNKVWSSADLGADNSETAVAKANLN
jgi:hypothetical protein